MTANRPIPDGFEPAKARGPFTTHNGPVYRASAEGDHRSGLLILDRHCNGMGFLHGGMASAFADSALAWGVWGLTRRRGVTIQLNMTFLRTVYEGDWLTAAPRITGQDEELIHVRADLVANGETLAARAEAVFRAVRRGPKSAANSA